ncbi:ATP-dependent Clp protease ATP-binding subunit [Mycoplasma procyoni]|uniref:ATP-dependent Clp protease ATP-binding subunit n=1 Tax=Mycoplasma procyoni TaxID=568784 RepID=UPI00197BCD24|nr:AAA family ATPase [Mycoplasma procyoni]MBN3534452.1 AAA family ATPase [Mycoplasma procyoni]
MNFQFNENKKPLEEFGRNLNELALQNKLDPVINRDDEIRRIITILSRKTKNNPVLVGEPGVGKTAIIEGLARKIVEGQVPEDLKNKQVWEIDLSAIIAGASYQGQFEDRLKKLLKQVEESNGEIIIFIDEIHMLIGAGKNGNSAMDAANIIKPLMARGQIKLIGATTLEEYKLYIETDAALERRMQKIDVSEPSVEGTIQILRGIKERMENFHNVKIDDDALISAAKLSARYINDRFLPDKAIDLIDEASANAKVEMNYVPEIIEKLNKELSALEIEKFSLNAQKNEANKEKIKEIDANIKLIRENISKHQELFEKEKQKVKEIAQLRSKRDDLKNKLQILQSEAEFEKAAKIMHLDIPQVEAKISQLENENTTSSLFIGDKVTESDIARVVSKWTKIPLEKLVEKEKDKVLNLNKHLQERIKGQDEAVELVYNAVLRSKANINDPSKPLASFIFAGPTGVGKTELARSLALNLFDSEKQLIRLDMSEYMEKHSVSKLIGSPPGYVGYEQGGQLTEKIRQNPYSIVLFDEIEKAHSDVVNILLQILDNGYLSDSKGRKINFRNTIIIMTTNIGANEILNNPKFSIDDLKQELLNFFRPEFINRVDEIIKFNHLDKKEIKKIINIELSRLIQRVYETSFITIKYSDSIVDYIANKISDSQFGARPIKHFIKREIETFLATKIINQEIKAQDNIELIVTENKVDFRKN